MLTHVLGSGLVIDVANLKTFVYHAKTPDINQVYLVEIVCYLLKLLLRNKVFYHSRINTFFFFFFVGWISFFISKHKLPKQTLKNNQPKQRTQKIDNTTLMYR
jgi:hypothetical protein